MYEVDILFVTKNNATLLHNVDCLCARLQTRLVDIYYLSPVLIVSIYKISVDVYNSIQLNSNIYFKSKINQHINVGLWNYWISIKIIEIIIVFVVEIIEMIGFVAKEKGDIWIILPNKLRYMYITI